MLVVASVSGAWVTFQNIFGKDTNSTLPTSMPTGSSLCIRPELMGTGGFVGLWRGCYGEGSHTTGPVADSHLFACLLCLLV